MPWFKKQSNRLLRLYSNSGRTYGALQFGIDAAGKPVVVGTEADLELDSLFSDGSASDYGKGSICLRTAGGISVVDSDGLWQAMTGTTVSQSVSPSHSASPSSSGSSSTSPSTSPSVSPSHSSSASASPSHSASPST
jgi:hypothetical protein